MQTKSVYNMASTVNSAHFLTLVQVLCLLLWIIPHAAAICRFGEVPPCLFPCHCASGRCDPDTGLCLGSPPGCADLQPPGMGYGWSGPQCQDGPIAARNITSDGGLRSLERLVDGDLSLNQSLDGHCVRFRPPRHTFIVSFSVPYYISSVQLVFPTERPLGLLRGDITLWSENDNDGQWDHRDRAPLRSLLPSRPHIPTLRCGAIATAIRVDIEQHFDLRSLALCEITAVGHRSIPCNSTHCLTGGCDSATGCSNCTAGKRLPGCIEDCEPGTFGESCASVCGRCEADAACHRQTGSCPGSCQMWSSGERCDVTIAKAHFSEEIAIASPLNATCFEVLWQPVRNISEELDGFYGYHVTLQTLHDSVATLRDEAFVAHDNSEYMLRVVLCGLEAEVGRQVIIEPYRKWPDGSRDPGQAYPIMDLYTENQSDLKVIVLAVILTLVMTLALILSVGCVITCRRHGGIKQTCVCRHDDATPAGARQPEAIYVNVAGPGQSATDPRATCRPAVKAFEKTPKDAYEPFNLETREVPTPEDTIYEDLGP